MLFDLLRVLVGSWHAASNKRVACRRSRGRCGGPDGCTGHGGGHRVPAGAARPGARPPRDVGTVTDLVVQAVRKRLADRAYPLDQRLPSQRWIAIEFATSLATVRLALLQLMLEGCCAPIGRTRRPGRMPSPPHRRPGRLSSWPICRRRCAGAGGHVQSSPTPSNARCASSSAPRDERELSRDRRLHRDHRPADARPGGLERPAQAKEAGVGPPE
ncbi:GntR family transcriptional regulator [Streptomyces sp. NPDC006197]|uniref:GntR family transcriptional regulator n=1 Tax=Streptomyces sp. NPDC006197 TaxID=3156685 RepID=UPI0033A5176D